MSTIKMYPCLIKKGNHKIRYVINKQLPGDPISVEGLSGFNPESIIKQFADVREAHDSKCKKPFAELIHSFSPEESKKLSPELINKIGYEVITTMFPGHQALVVTHLDRDHYHNHIILNRHHMRTGKLTRNSIGTVKSLRELNDRVCASHGLSVPSQAKREREARMPQKVAKMIRYHRSSYIADMMQKADFARAIATSYDQYQGILAEFGIAARIEKKNISYSYPGQKFAKRGKNMGTLYDKPGLEKAFKENDERFHANPVLRQILTSKMAEIKATPGAMKGLAGELAAATGGHFKSGVKDYSKHEILPRREARWARASEEDLAFCLVPIGEIRKAQRASIPGYCKQKGITLVEKAPGTYIMPKRPYVEISEYEWRNTKNNTRGNLIDLVAAHKQISFLAAIAEINGNKRLLLLQQEMGEVKRTYTSFYVPKADRDQSPAALHHLTDLFGRHGAKQDQANELLKSGQAHVMKGGVIRLFGKDDEFGTTEYVKDDQGTWKKEQRGQFTKPFFAMGGNGRHLNVYVDPFTFMRSRSKNLFPEKKENAGSLVLMEPNTDMVDQFLGGNRSVDTLRLVVADRHKPTQAELDFFGTLKARYQSHGVAVEFISIEKTMPGRGLSLER